MRKLKIILISYLLILIGCDLPVTQTNPSPTFNPQNGVVYGEDSVQTIDPSLHPMINEWAALTAIQIHDSYLLPVSENEFKISTSTFGEKIGLCPDEKDFDTLTPGNCSGFLVAPDVILTAGHCLRTQDDCSYYRWIFDFRDENKILNATEIYSCKEIMEQKEDSVTKADYALIKLDRPYPHFHSTEMDFSPYSVITGNPILVLGHPSGRPLRSTVGTVRSYSNDFYFVGNPDTFAGNSGSPVFNLKTEKFVGVLVRGENDYVLDQNQNCNHINRCPEDGCRGEDITRLSIIPFLSGLFAIHSL